MDQDFDIFGNPIEVADAKLGRPVHEVTEENIIFVMVLLAAGATNKEVADTLGVSIPTLRKHYLHLVKRRDLMLDRLRTKLRVTQIQQGLGGNASALNAALNMLERVRTEQADRRVKGREKTASPATARLGKKEEKRQAAARVTGKFAPPSGPQLVVDNAS